MLKNQLTGYPVEEFTTTNSSKREIIEYLIQRVDNEKIKLLDDKEQYVEFSSYAMEITNSGAITYNGLPGTHDDCCIAAALAMKGIKDLENNSYSISFGTNHRKTRKYN
jgi:hypothetical protein